MISLLTWDRALAAKHAGEHRDTLLGEGVRTCSADGAPRSFNVANCDLEEPTSSEVKRNMKSAG